MKKALVFGITGQDGSYLSEFLLNKGYKVIGIKRRSSSINTQRIDHLIRRRDTNLEIYHGDITDTCSVYSVLSAHMPDEIYNLAAQSHVGVSFNEPEYTAQVDAVGTLRLLEAVRSICPGSKFYQASTSELYGGLSRAALSEDSNFNPRSPYAAAKLFGFNMVEQYRNAYSLKAWNGILFNHESPRRGENFVSRKITQSIARMLNGELDMLTLGNLNAVRDWGHAADYVEAMWTMLEKTVPGNYVVATGIVASVRDFCRAAFKLIGIDIMFKGSGANEVGYIERNNGIIATLDSFNVNRILINVDKRYFRPLEVEYLEGDSTKFRVASGWAPKYDFRSLVRDMMSNDLQAIASVKLDSGEVNGVVNG